MESITLLQDLPLPIEITDDNRRALERFDLSWAPPLEPFGEIREYVIYVGSSLQQGSDTFGFEKFTVSYIYLLYDHVHAFMFCIHVCMHCTVFRSV